MDCEKFESTLLGELYDELDEVTSAAAKRHVGGCSRCASLLSGLKATRRVAVLPLVDPPADLEERILAAAREAQRVIPLTRRASRAISWAGSWAMRPQTAMAAVFLLGIGLSALLVRGKHAANSTMTVSEQGEPIPSAVTGTIARPVDQMDDKKSDSKGAAAPLPSPPSPPPTAVAMANDYRSQSAMDGVLARGHASASGEGASGAAPPAGPLSGLEKQALNEPQRSPAPPTDRDDARNAEALAGAPAGQYARALAPSVASAAAAPAPQPAAPDVQSGLGGGGAKGLQSAPGVNEAVSAYNAGDYGAATALFDRLASNGDLNSALWAARSARKGSGCAQAAPRFDQVARAGAGTSVGYDATFEGGQCYRQMGQWDAAQTHFRSLITVPSYVDRAKMELATMGQRAATKPAKPAAPQAPASQQPTPAASPPVHQAPNPSP